MLEYYLTGFYGCASGVPEECKTPLMREMDRLNLFSFPHEIRDYLTVRGDRRAGESCPVSVHLSRVAPGESPYVGTDAVETPSVTYRMSRTLQEFIRRFDAGAYPELVSGGE